jgi:hypothetical protein
MRLKCGVCHRVPAGSLSPAAIPTAFDLNYHLNSPGGVPGAVTVIPFLQGGVLRGSVGSVPRMPLDYATPLSEDEIQALEAWDGS